MSLTKVKGNGRFEWKINTNYVLSSTILSSEILPFAIDGYEVQLFCELKLYTSAKNKVYHFRLNATELECCSKSPVPYTFSILDREEHVFVTSKGTAWLTGIPEKRTLMIIDGSYLKAWNLFENSTFTVRFSLDRELDAQAGSHPSKAKTSDVTDSTTNTICLVTKDSSTNTDTAYFLETLSNDFSTFYESKMSTDCVLKVSDTQFHVHRAVLSARSSVFSAMFHHDTDEKHSGEVNILDVEETALGNVLYYLYSGKIRGLTTGTATSIYIVADKYDLLELRTECCEFLKCNLTLDNFCEVALLAHTHAEMELEERVVWFIEDKLDEVLESTSWQQFSKDKTLLANRLLTSVLKTSKKKQF